MTYSLRKAVKEASSKGILVQALGSTGPGLSWQYILAIIPQTRQVTIYHGDLQENEIYDKNLIGGPLDTKRLVEYIAKQESLHLEDEFYNEISISGIKGYWKDMILLSLHAHYSLLVDELVSFSEDQYKTFVKTNGKLIQKNTLNYPLLDRIEYLTDEISSYPEISNTSLAELLTGFDKTGQLDLDSLESEIINLEKQKEEREEIKRKKEERIKGRFKEIIDYYVKYFTRYTNLRGKYITETPSVFGRGIHANLSSFLEDYVIKHNKMPDKRIYIFKMGVWIRTYVYIFDLRDKTQETLNQNQPISGQRKIVLDAIDSINTEALIEDWHKAKEADETSPT